MTSKPDRLTFFSALFAAAFWVLVALALMTWVGPIRRWADGDEFLILAAVAAVFLSSAARATEAPDPGGLMALGLVTPFIALLLSVHFRTWAGGLPLWAKLLGGYVFGATGLAFGVPAANTVARRVFPVLRVLGSVEALRTDMVAVPYGAGLFYLVGASSWAMTKEPLDFWRNHLFDGVTCGGAIALGFVLLTLRRTDAPQVTKALVAYFITVSCAIAEAAAFVAGNTAPDRYAVWGLFACGSGLLFAVATMSLSVQRKLKKFVAFVIRIFRVLDFSSELWTPSRTRQRT